MKYWLYFLAKLGAIAAVFSGLWWVMERVLPQPPVFHTYQLGRFGQDFPWTAAIFGFSLLAAGCIYLAVLDQRFRCRACLRRLRMPVTKGAWDSMLRIGKPEIEYICPFGHGTLTVREVHLTGIEGDAWREHDSNIWKELENYEETKRQ